MIDDKKIDEAVFYLYQKGELKYIGDGRGFKKGAKWAIEEFLKDLWHPASEEPKTSKLILTKCQLDIVEYKDMMFLGIIPWNQKVENEGIICWLYIDDLLPKKGGRK